MRPGEDSKEEIWARWQANYEQRDVRYIKDGILNADEFAEAQRKILFVLKDTNDLWDDYDDLRKFLRDGPKELWHTVAIWAAGLLEYFSSSDFPQYDEVNCDEKKKKSLKQIAAINLKKVDGKATVAREVLNAYAHHDQELLKEQIESIAPDLIIACGEGVIDALIWILDLEVNPDKPREPVKDKNRNIWAIPFRHPACGGGEAHYNRLAEIVMKLTL